MFLCQQRKLFPKKSCSSNKFMCSSSARVCSSVQLFFRHVVSHLIFIVDSVYCVSGTSNTSKFLPATHFEWTAELWGRKQSNKQNYAWICLWEFIQHFTSASLSILRHYSRTMALASRPLCAEDGRGWSWPEAKNEKNLHIIRRTQYYITHNLAKWSFIDTSVPRRSFIFRSSAFLVCV